MSVSVSDVLGIAPEFSALSASVIQVFIDDALLSFNQSVWAEKLDVGHKYLTAHRIEISYPGGATGGSASTAGPVTSEKVGDLTTQYGKGSGSSLSGDQMLAQTKYGRTFLSIQAEIIGAPIVITPGFDQTTL